MLAKSQFIVRGGADFSSIQNEMAKTEKGLKGFESRVNGMFKGVSQGLGINLGALTKVGMIAAATKALYDFSKQAIDVASDLREVQNVVDTTFGSMAQEVNEFARNSIKDFGLSELSAKQYTSTMGAMLKSSGITGEAVKDMSIEMTKLTADVASFYNLEGDVAFQKIRSGLSGQTEPLKQLGINMNVANMEAYALSQGIRKSWKEMNQAEQTMLRYNYLLNVTGDAQGDFAKESGTWANQVKILKEQWQEYIAIFGQLLTEVLLPFVKAANKYLEVLIKVAREMSKIYTMVTGKELTIESNNNISDAAEDAADGENKLASGIDKAAKAAKKALAPFDELNILQSNLSGSGSGGLAGAIGNGGLNTIMSTEKVDDGLKIKIDYEEPKKFFIWFADKWNGLKQMLSIPITAPAPIFASIPNPIYEPNWNLTPPLIPSPVFEPIRNPIYSPNWNLDVPTVLSPVFASIPNPVYNPVWNLVPPLVPEIVFNPIDYKEYNKSLETIKGKMTETKTTLEGIQKELSKRVEEEAARVSKKVETGLSTSWGTVETNYNKHKENVGVIATGISTVLVANINQGLSKVGTNINNAITTTQNNLQTWGKNFGSIAIETSKTLTSNISEGLKATAHNTVSFANSQLNNLSSWGSGVLSIAGETAKGFASNMASGFRNTWDSFKSLMSSMGEKVSGWWSDNGNVVVKTGVAIGATIGLGALAFSAPAAIPYGAAAMLGLATIPKLAKGGITNGEMVALIGDNPGGREVVSPLDDLMNMITTAVSSTSNNNNGGDMTIIVKIGDDTITEKMVSNINRQNRISGKTVIKV